MKSSHCWRCYSFFYLIIFWASLHYNLFVHDETIHYDAHMASIELTKITLIFFQLQINCIEELSQSSVILGIINVSLTSDERWNVASLLEAFLQHNNLSKKTLFGKPQRFMYIIRMNSFPENCQTQMLCVRGTLDGVKDESWQYMKWLMSWAASWYSAQFSALCVRTKK